MSTARNSRAGGRPASARPAAWVVTVGVAAGLGLALACASLALPYLVSALGADPALGALDGCLQARLRRPRLGWAVDFQGQRVAGFDAARLALCGPGAAAQVLARPGVVAAAFDGAGHLWVADGRGLWREGQAQALAPLADFAAVALAGHAQGVLALDAQGHLLSLSEDGRVLGAAQLPAAAAAARAQLSVGPAATLGAVVAAGALWAYELPALTPLAARAPCAVRLLWWLEAPGRVLLSCEGPPPAARELHLPTGAHAPAHAAPRAPSVRLAGRPLHVTDCEGLPCSAPVPRGGEAGGRAMEGPPPIEADRRAP